MESEGTENDNDALVGGGRWGYMKIVDILTTCASSRTLLDNVFTLARRLEIPVATQKILERRLSANTAEYNEILYDILEAWRGSKSKGASIFALVRELEKCKLQDCSDSLRAQMSQNEKTKSYLLLSACEITESHSWKDLSDEVKIEMSEKYITYQGNILKLGQLSREVQNLIDGKTLRQLTQGEIPTIVNNQVPPQLQYYIQRRVKNRFTLKKEILIDTECKDVLIIQGLERHKLTSFVEDSFTDVSGNQIKKLTVRLILLEHEIDFEKICKLSDVPVHWIIHEDDVYEWVKSSGSVKMIQKYVDQKNQDCLEESDLILRKDKVVVISDSPGMGKTNLLVNLANVIMKDDNTLLVRFIVLQEFLRKLYKKENTIDNIVALIAEQSSDSEFGRTLVTHILKFQPCVLMFDGLDEVLLNQISAAKEVLKAVAALKQAQIYVTTRQHLRDELEQTLHVLGYTIEPFGIPDQADFLSRYWSSIGIDRNESVQKFADSCLQTLASKMTDFERNIAGIPLQCRILAETYAEDAERCSVVGYWDSNSIEAVSSIFKMYEKHMKMRFQKICNEESLLKRVYLFMLSKENQYNVVKRAHMYYALKLMFPEEIDHLLPSKVLIPLHDLCGLGILEATHKNDIRFVHRTFAEYLVAWFVMELDDNEKSNSFIMSQIFKTQREDSSLHFLPFEKYWTGDNGMLECYKFNFPVICQFINGLAEKRYIHQRDGPSVPNLRYSSELVPVYFASARQNYIYVPLFASKLFKNEVYIECNDINMNDLVFITTQYSGIELLKIFCHKHHNLVSMPFVSFDDYNSVDDFYLTPLHLAVHRGHYNLVEYLVKKYEKELPGLSFLFHMCVAGSLGENSAVLQEKKQILKMLLTKSKQWLNEHLSLYSNPSTTPLLQDQCSWELRECLLREGADVNEIDQESYTLLYKIASDHIIHHPATPEWYHRVVFILKENGYQHFHKLRLCEYSVDTPLFWAVREMEVLQDTVRLFHSNGADFNAIEDRETLLFLAIRRGRSTKLIGQLVDCGADYKLVNYQGKTVLHYCVEYNHSEALEYFLKNHQIDVNVKDKFDENTALHYAMVERSGRYEFMQKLLIEAGTDMSLKNFWKRTPFMEAFGRGFGLTLSTISLMKKHSLNINKQVALEVLNYFELRLKQKLVSETDFGDDIHYLWRKSEQPKSEFCWNL